MKSYIAILISLLVALAPISGTAQETQGQRGIAVAKKTPTAVRFTGTPTLVAQLGNAGSDSGFERGALSPDGNYALTSDGDLDAVLWDVSSGRQLRRFVGNSDPYVFLPDNTGAVMTLGATAVLLDIQTGSEMRRFEKEPSEISPIAKKRWGGEPFALRSMAVSPDGKKLLVLYSMMNPKCQSNCGDDVSEVVLFDVETGEELNRFNESGRPLLLSIALSPDGRRVLVGGKNSRATLWDAESGTQLRTFDMGKEYVNDVDVVRFSPDGTRVLMALSAWDSKKKERGYCYKANNGSPGITGPCTTVWDTETGEQLQRFPFVSSSFSFKNDDVWFSPDGRYVVHSYPFTMYDVNTGALVRRTEESRRALDHSLVDNKILLLGDGEDKSSMVLWDLQSGQVAQNFKSRGATSINSVSWSRDGRMILIGDANKAYLWDLAAGKLVQQYAEPLEQLSLARPRGNYYDYFATPVERAILSPDNRRVLTVGSEGRAILWNAATGAQERRLAGHKGPVFAGDISPDGRLVATGGEDKTVRLWDIETGRQLASWGARWAVVDVAFSADGTLLAAGTFDNNMNRSGQVLVWDVASRKALKSFSGKPLESPIMTVAFSPDGQGVFSAGWDYIRGWEINTGKEAGSLPVTGVTDMAFSPDGTRTLLQGEEGASTVALHDSENGDVIFKVQHDGPVNALEYSPDGQWIVTGSADRTTRIWSAVTGAEQARLITFRDGTYAVTNPEGRFDASNGGEVDGLHWVAGLEPIALSQLKSRYYEPGLLAKLLGLSDEPLRDVESLMAGSVDLFPEVIVTQAPTASDRSLRLQLNDRGGGIGRVAVFVNGKEVTEDARAAGTNAQAQQLNLVVNLTGNKFLIAGQDNQIEVVAYNGDNYLASPRVLISAGAMAAATVEKPQLWSIVAGVSDYVGAGLDLRFAAKDAEDFATALAVAAERLLGAEHVHITHLYDGKAPATRANLRAAFETFKQARPGDILVLYLAGHGTAYGGQEGDYYYLLQDAENGDLSNPAVRAQVALSSQELTEWIKEVPALKQVLILDTCHAGQLITDLTRTRGLPSAELRSLDRMKDRTGMFIIAGSAADAVSYEASRYGQGVLTYSLLEGMRGAALRENAFVDVGQLLTYAVDRVPALARGIGGIQQPRMATPSGGESFDMGWLPAAADLAKIPIAEERPLLLKTSFTPEDQPLDVLELTPMVNEALRTRAADPRNAPFVFVEADQSAGAWRVAGRYGVVGTTVTLKVYLYQDKSVAGQFDVQGQTSTLAALTAEIVQQVEARMKQ